MAAADEDNGLAFGNEFPWPNLEDILNPLQVHDTEKREEGDLYTKTDRTTS